MTQEAPAWIYNAIGHPAGLAMLGICMLFLGVLCRAFIGEDATDLVQMPLGLDLPLGSEHGAAVVVLQDGIRMSEISLWQSYLAGCFLLGIAPCTAMVLIWATFRAETTGSRWGWWR